MRGFLRQLMERGDSSWDAACEVRSGLRCTGQPTVPPFLALVLSLPAGHGVTSLVPIRGNDSVPAAFGNAGGRLFLRHPQQASSCVCLELPPSPAPFLPLALPIHSFIHSTSFSRHRLSTSCVPGCPGAVGVGAGGDHRHTRRVMIWAVLKCGKHGVRAGHGWRW